MPTLQTNLLRHLGDLTALAAGEHEHLWLCSAYVSRDGVSAIDSLLDTTKTTDGIFGAGPLTDPAALQSLHNRGSRLHLVPHDPGSEFHPKCYFGRRRDGQAWAAIGSANLTGGGAGRNVELLAATMGPGDHPFFAELTDWLEEVRSFSLPCTSELLVQAGYARAGQQEDVRERSVLPDPWADALQALYATHAPDTPVQTAKDLVHRLHHEALLNYIRTTKVFASYKLVILALTLTAPGGNLSLTECARRFHAFYLHLHAAGRQPERATGSPRPPAMLHPDTLSQSDVERLLMDEPRKAFANTGHVIVFARTPTGIKVQLAPSLWNATTRLSRQIALQSVRDRLEAYYETHTRSTSDIVAALAAASGQGPQ